MRQWRSGAIMLAAMAAVAWAQGKAIPTYVDAGSLAAHDRSVVLVQGTSGTYTVDKATNATVYRFTDKYDHSVWVRCASADAPDQGTQYTIIGTVTSRAGGGYEIIEDASKRVKGWGPPAGATQDDGKGKGKDKGGSKGKEPANKNKGLLIAGGSLIGLALVLMLVLWRQQAVACAQEAALAAEAQQQQLWERQQQLEHELAAARQGGGVRPETVLATGAGAPARSSTLMTLGKLVARQGPHAGETFALASTVNVIGRAEGDVKLSKDETTSGRHARIVFSNDGRVVFADESRNGSRVNGEAVHQAQRELASGDVLEIGLSTLEFVNFRTPHAAPGGTDEAAQRRAATVMVEAAPPSAKAPADASRATTAMFLGAELKVIGGPDQGLALPLQQELSTIGRLDSQDLRLQDATVSREHGTVSYLNGCFIYSNLSSRGSKVNGRPAQREELQDGDQIELGGTVLQFRRLS